MDALLWGLEEEGIPAMETNLPEGNIQQQTWEIARQSRLNVAIGAGQTGAAGLLITGIWPQTNPCSLRAFPVRRYECIAGWEQMQHA